MKDGYRKCMRCYGRKQIYKVGGAWSFTNTGGVLTNCPLCQGDGIIPTLGNAVAVHIEEDSKTKTHIECSEDVEQKKVIEELFYFEPVEKNTQAIVKIMKEEINTKTESKKRGGSNAKEKSRTRKT